MYLDQTYGPLRLDEMSLWMEHFRNWPVGNRRLWSMPKAARWPRSSCWPRSSTARSISPMFPCAKKSCSSAPPKNAVWRSPARLPPITCFSAKKTSPKSGFGRGEVRPRLATRADQQALWDNLDVIDCFATDHAPHTLAEKDGENPRPVFPGWKPPCRCCLRAVQKDG